MACLFEFVSIVARPVVVVFMRDTLLSCVGERAGNCIRRANSAVVVTA